MDQSQNTPPARRPDVVGEQVEDELVLLLPHAGAVIVLNDVGRTIWELIDGRRSAEAIAAELCAEYEVEPAQAYADTVAFLTTLRERGVLI